ncbi:MAG TPA: hypothetical protein PK147_01290 [Saprospiraceae bacterium]|nr:hypothetical protein [Saprospiraceae bacterium]HPK08699.1 hypothetical protein [Saprospiraceae bacterium]HPQ20451.1 hypothetical protein [Saprospiraceae bacterium]
MKINFVKLLIRAAVLIAIQVLLLKRISFSLGDFSYVHFFIYPLFILLLPFNQSRTLYLILGFILGLTIDMFYNTPGVHAAATVLMAYLREPILNWIAPYQGYPADATPTIAKMGLVWFFSYSSTLMFIHLFMFFFMESFSFIYIFEIMLNTFFSLIGSELIIMVYMLISRPTS